MAKYLLLTIVAATLAMVTAVETAFAQEPPPPFSATVVDIAANIRAEPDSDADLLGVARLGDDIWVVDVVAGENPDGGSGLWYQTASGGYIYSRFAAAKVAGYGRWIDVDLTEQTATAMEGWTPIYTAETTTGRDGWETPVGTFNIQRRIFNEIMDGATIGIPPGSPGYYYFPNVLYTQYFTPSGAALHYNYWGTDDVFGERRTSRGCVGLRLEDAEFFWNFADLGTVVRVHY
ncbi:MAG: L,D-transpeptidase [Chloroflexota bacterium]|jgi:hypothetical protein